MRYFEPVDQAEHERGNAGYDVPDYCLHCGQPFMEHTNGVCPEPEKKVETGVTKIDTWWNGHPILTGETPLEEAALL